MNNDNFQTLTFEEKYKYAHEHPTEVYYELTEKGYELLKELEKKTIDNNQSNI